MMNSHLHKERPQEWEEGKEKGKEKE